MSCKKRPMGSNPLMFEALPIKQFSDPSYEFDKMISDDDLVDFAGKRIKAVAGLLDKHYSGSIIPTLYKNVKKCEHLAKEARAILAAE